GRCHERSHFLVTGLDEFDLAVGAIERAKHAVDAVTRITEHFFDAPRVEPLNKKIANGLGHGEHLGGTFSEVPANAVAMMILERRRREGSSGTPQTREIMSSSPRMASQHAVPIAIAAAGVTATKGSLRAIEELIVAAAMIGTIGSRGEILV